MLGAYFCKKIFIVFIRWLAPISMAIYSPGMDFFKALDAVRYLLSCDPQKELIQKYVTFHFYFDRNHTPKDVSFYLMFFF